MKIGMIGAGRLGQALARRLKASGHEIMLSNSRGKAAVLEIAASLGCEAGDAATAANFGDVVVVSVPMSAFDKLPVAEIGRRVVIDTCNYYPDRDGIYPALEKAGETTSGLLQRALPEACVVKAFNSVMAHHLAKGGMSPVSGARHALPFAGTTPTATAIVASLISDAGFDPVLCGGLDDSWRFERARPAYCRVFDADGLRDAIARTTPNDFVPEGSWRG